MKVLTCVVTAALLLTACSSNSVDSGTSVTGSAATRGDTSGTSATPRQAGGTISTDRCGIAAERVHPFTLRVGDASLPAARLGAGTNVAVLLHQTDGDAACGWLPAAQLMAARGIQLVAFDMCGYGAARCEDRKPPTPAAQVTAAVSWARQHGATRVTVVGASMGGSIALGTAGTVAPQAVVDLSGPMSWEGVQDSAAAARALRIPLLAAASPDDPNSDATALAKAIASSRGRHHRFVRAEDGHGVELMTSYSGGKIASTPLLRVVVRWVQGNYV